MANPRRRRTVIVVVTLSFVLVGQLPNLVNIIVRPWQNAGQGPGPRYLERSRELNTAYQNAQISPQEYQQQSEEASKQYQADLQQSKQLDANKLEQTSRIINLALPPAWLPLGAADLATGAVLPALLGGLGLTLVGSVCLMRAYRTTLRMYSGYDRGGSGKVATPVETKPTGPTKVRLIEWQLPRVSERAAAVAAAGFRSLLRHPEAKIALIVPIILVIVFGSIFLSLQATPPLAVRPLFAFGVCTS